MSKYFVYIKNTQGGVDPVVWKDDWTKGNGQFQKGPVKNWADAEPGDLVAFHHITDEQKRLWAEHKIGGGGGTTIDFYSKLIPFFEPAREQDKFPEGEG